jgi:chromosome partitioning protein
MHRSEIAAFLNQKGGVGKTTSVVNVGAGLTILGKKVLIVDLDPQGHLTRFLGVEPHEVETTIYDVFRGAAARDAIITTPLRARLSVNGQDSQLSMAVIPATLEFAGAETDLAGTPGREFLFKRAIDRIRDDFDYVLIDCSPSLGLVTINALAASQKVFIPIQTEFLALESLQNLLTRIESVTGTLSLDVEVAGLIATRFDGRKVLSRTVVQTLREHFGALLMNTMIRDNIALAESPRFGKDIFSYQPRSFGAEDYLNLSLEVMGRIATADALFSVERGVITSNESAGVAY